MDSFYDVPRRAPIPTYVDQISATPTVPEVSLLCNATKAPWNDYVSYNAWKYHQDKAKRNQPLSPNGNNIMHPDFPPCNSGLPVNFNSPQNACQFSKKQVRFQSPMQQQRPSLTYEPFLTRKKGPPSDIKSMTPSREQDIEIKSAMTNKPFQQIYMANIPNHQLDLSIIDVPTVPINPQHVEEIAEKPGNGLMDGSDDKKTQEKTDNSVKGKENKLPKTYRDFLEMQKTTPKPIKHDLNDSVIDIFNYKRNSAKPENIKCQQIHNIEPFPDNGISSPRSVETLSQFRHMMISNDSIQRDDYGSDIHRNNIMTISNSRTAMQNHNTCEFQEQNPPCTGNFQKGTPIKSCEESTQTSVISSSQKSTETAVQIKDESEPSTKDLLKIISKQNEQLMLLQRQVATLLERDHNQNKPIENGQKMNYIGERCVTSTQNEHFKHDNLCTPRKRAGMSKFSIDLMTSFEVAIRPQPKSNFVNCEPKIQEITESESLASNKDSDKQVDQSLQLKEPVRIQESCPSPEPSININMNDYDSSDDEVSASEIGATFYNNLMGQVNNILKKAQMQTKEDLFYNQENKASANPDKKIRTLNRVKEATLRHLKNIGVTVGATEDTDSSVSFEDSSKKYTPTEISFAVKQLLMKYLPDDELAKIQPNQMKHTPADKKDQGFISPRPEFSFASVQYMKKYNLIPSNETKGTTNRFAQKPVQRIQQAQVDNPKILDMTALKMQPKLL